MEPVIESISAIFDERLTCLKVNIDDNRALAREMRVGSIPSILLMDDGKVVHRWQGLTGKEMIMQELNKLITDN
jgi:thioredoxin-like negative regulator of GroEL